MRRWLVGVLAGLLVPVGGIAAQEEPGETGPSGLSGVVLDAQAETPVAGATVALVPGTDAVFPAGLDDARAFATANRVVETGQDGTYRFTGLAAGEYVLRIECLGYRPATVRVEIRGPGPARVSVGLDLAPIRLEPVDVTGEARDLLHARPPGDGTLELGRLPAVRLRQQRHLPTDVRVLTHDELVEANTLGEVDIFRALRRLPGVTSWDDVSAELWIRGAGRGETLTLFDGLPLYEPMHGDGDLTAVSPEGIGLAFLHPGVRPADLANGSAAVVDLRTRPGAGDERGGVRGAVDVSMSSARVAMDGRSSDGDFGWMLAGRRSYLDLFMDRVFQFVSANQFWDLTGRADMALPGDRALELSGLWQSNGYQGEEFAWLAEWDGGSRRTSAGRASVSTPLFGLRARQTIGYSGHRVESGAYTPSDLRPERADRPALDAGLGHVLVRGEVEPSDGEGGWRAGYDIVREIAEYDGPAPPRRPADYDDAPGRLVFDGSSTRLGLWGQRRWRVTDALDIEAGVRLETGGTSNAGAARIAPNLMGRLAVGEHARLFAGLGRSYQYAQTIAPTGTALPGSPGLASPPNVWLLAGDSLPAIRSDVATVGGELWLGGSWMAAVNGYARRSTGLALPDPEPGLAEEGRLYVAGRREAYGIEASLRRVAGRATWSLAYSYGRATTEADGHRFPAATERPHAVDATGLVRLGRGFRVGAAAAYVSGIPYTRATRVALADGTEHWRLGEPNARRTTSYGRLDLFVDWSRRFDGWELGVYLQGRNILGRANQTWYLGSYGPCGPGLGATADCPQAEPVTDHFSGGASGANLGIRVTF